MALTTHHPHHALAIADEALLMPGAADYTAGPAAEVLTEKSLTILYGAPLKRIVFDHEGRRVEIFAPVLAMSGADGKAVQMRFTHGNKGGGRRGLLTQSRREIFSRTCSMLLLAEAG